MKKKTKRIAIFASGGGSNAEAILQYFDQRQDVAIVLICTNKSTAGVLDRAERHGIATHIFSKAEYTSSQALIETIEAQAIDLVVLAGYLKLIPADFTRHFSKRIINIHPGLLPEFGGKGMYGMHVHEAVIAQQAPCSGITIHYVDDEYDHGATIFQHAIPVQSDWAAKDLAKAVLAVEHAWYPRVLDGVLKT